MSEDTMANNLPVSLVPPALLGNPTPQPTPSPAVRLPSAGATTAGDQSQSVAGVGTVNPSPIRPTATKPPAAVLLPEAYQPQPRFLRFGMPPLLLYGITTLDPAVARYLYAGAVVTGLMGLYLILSALTLPRLLMPARSLNRISL
ncbi:MAG TPA: hypothetical protein VK963_04165 [Candidatus Saccharimonadales bacterium]|nr:hypothetical protein [Candidatus Saccharimonadales bacterium]